VRIKTGGTTCRQPNRSVRRSLPREPIVGSLSDGVNAIVDALSVLGIKHIDTPCTPHRLWQAIANAGACVTTTHQPNACNHP
jgi:hypothetical protein